MGMFDKDKEIGRRIDGVFDFNEPFILWAAEIDKEIDGTPKLIEAQKGLPGARKSLLEVSRMATPDQRFEVVSLGSAIADKVEQAEVSDFPSLVELVRVKGRFDKEGERKTLALQFVGSYVKE